MMSVADYYNTLGLQAGASTDEIKKAYRKKARQYHPDLNQSPDARDMFIKATEAYELLLSISTGKDAGEEEYKRLMEEWIRYRQEMSRRRAAFYARASYNRFKNTKFYRSTRILNGTTIIFNFAISILVLVYTIYGFLFRLRYPYELNEKPPVFSFIILLLLSVIMLTGSVIYLKAYLQGTRDKKKRDS
ncbi:MAG: DnaJ domain-containing protein [Bacteroidales bacterium]|nr:DnaJ domain-containing protein [Bacteroidales bacterium]